MTSNHLVVPLLADLPSELATLALIQQHVTLQGYALSAVEEWLLARRPVPLIVDYTGNQQDEILVNVYAPRPEHSSRRAKESLKMAHKMLASHGFHPKETPLGILFVCSEIPAASTVRLPSPAALKGSTQRDLYLNINLRRLGCGGRSNLSLGRPTIAQQDKCIGLYQLHQVTDPSAFAKNVLDLVGLVHQALSLFGLGPLQEDLAARMDALKSNRPIRRQECPSDGLLCDFTIAQLDEWYISIGKATLEFDRGPDYGSALPPDILAGLISIVIVTMQRLIGVKIHDVPRDPFVNRQRFLACVADYKNDFRVSRYSSHFLDVSIIAQIRNSFNTRKSLRKVIRRGADALSAQGQESFEDPTVNMHAFALMVQKGWAPYVEAVQRLWAGKEAKGREDTSETDGEGVKGLKKFRKTLSNIPNRLLESSTRAHPDFSALGDDPRSFSPATRPRNDSVGTNSSKSISSQLDLDREQYIPTEEADHKLEQAMARVDPNSTSRPANLGRSATDFAVKRKPSLASTGTFLTDEGGIVTFAKRRHSFANGDLVEDIAVQDEMQLQTDVDLCMTVRALRQRRENLRTALDKLKLLSACYAAAHSKIHSALEEKRQQVQGFHEQIDSRPSLLETPVTPDSGVHFGASLRETAARTQFALKSIEDALKELGQHKERLEGAVGAHGSLLRDVQVVKGREKAASVCERVWAAFGARWHSQTNGDTL